MENEQARAFEVLEYAIQMEIDGKAYYQEWSGRIDNRVGKELFAWLAIQEDVHRQRFEKIYSEVKAKKTWPEMEIKEARHNFHNLFAEALKATGAGIKTPPVEIDAVSIAMNMEDKSLDYYRTQARKATYPVEKNFYEALAGEERGHYLMLVSYREYALNPEGYFRNMERQSHDAGG